MGILSVMFIALSLQSFKHSPLFGKGIHADAINVLYCKYVVLLRILLS